VKWLINNVPRGILAKRAQALLVCCLTLIPVHSVTSAIHACRLADGTVTYQDTECAVIPQAEAKPQKKTAQIPFGIDSTWFDAPSVVPDRAICTKNGCHCGMFSRKFKGGLPLAIADALYVDGSWHRLESTVMQLDLGQDTLSSIDKRDLRIERDEAACNILMSQKTLRLFGPDVLSELRDKKRYAEDRGLDDTEKCDAGDDLVCNYTESITLYQRINSDIKALRIRSRIASDENDVLATSDKD